jgi:hypothetical protein
LWCPILEKSGPIKRKREKKKTLLLLVDEPVAQKHFKNLRRKHLVKC